MDPQIRIKDIKMVPIGKLKPHPKNPNKHTPEQIQRLAEIIEFQGWRYPIKVSKQSGFITSGHGRLDAAKLKGWKQVPVSVQKYDSEEQEYADVVSDNAIASWSELDLSSINADLGDLGPDFDIDLLGIKDFEIDIADKEPGCDEDEIPEVKKSFVEIGDVWKLGNHRLMCGDCTDEKLVSRLMAGEKIDMVFTDPPYGIALNTDYVKTKPKGSKPEEFTRPINSFKAIAGDNRPFDASAILKQFSGAKEIFIFGANNFLHTIPDYQKGSWVCWDRTGGQTSLDETLGSTFELCWSLQRHKYQIARVTWKGVCGHSKKDDGAKKTHPSMKPVALVAWFFEHWGRNTNSVADPFGGSGSTLIACEKTNRKCFMMEIDPHYCGGIIERWQKYTGQKAEKLNA